MYVTKFIGSAANKTVGGLISYLEKESVIMQNADSISLTDYSMYLDKQNRIKTLGREYFFNGYDRTIERDEVVRAIDKNVKGLKKSEARYYTFAISPSKNEIDHLKEYCNTVANKLCEFNPDITDKNVIIDSLMREHLKEYTERCMDEYALNFGRNSIKSNKDILWFGVVENDRYWKKNDEKVIANKNIDKKISQIDTQLAHNYHPDLDREKVELYKQYHRENVYRDGGSNAIIREMMPKSGENWHVHVVVSRRDAHNKTSLSPNSNCKWTDSHKINGQKVVAGFNRDQFKLKCENKFDGKFNYRRLFTESYEAAKLKRDDYVAYLKCALEDKEKIRLRLSDMPYTDSDHIEQLRHYESFINRKLFLRENQERICNENITGVQQFNNLSINLADNFVDKAGLNELEWKISPIRTVRKGISFMTAINKRQAIYNNWLSIYENQWYKDNYIFDSIDKRIYTEAFDAKLDFLADKYGESPVLYNCQRLIDEYNLKCEKWLGNYIKTNFNDISGSVPKTANEFFDYVNSVHQSDAISHIQAFETQFQDYTPVVNDIQEVLTKYNLEQTEWIQNKLDIVSAKLDFEDLLKQYIPVSKHAEYLEAYNIFHANLCKKQEKELLNLITTKHQKYASVIQDFRRYTIDKLQLKIGNDKKNITQELGRVNKSLGKITQEIHKKLKNTIDSFIMKELPNYKVLAATQVELENLIKDVCTSSVVPQYIEMANKHIIQQLKSNEVFAEHSKRLFGVNVSINNEQEYREYVKNHFSPQQTKDYEKALQNVFADIEKKRSVAIQDYVDKHLKEQTAAVWHKQKYINRYITRTQSKKIACVMKESLQKRVASQCKSKLQDGVQYKTMNSQVMQKIMEAAQSKTNVVKLVHPTTLVLKAALELGKLLIKGI